MTYKMITPDEPPIGTVVRAGIGFTWSRTEKGWQNSNGTLFTWSELLADGEELEDITPLRTWAQPIEPPIGTKVLDHEGDRWERTGSDRWGWQMSEPAGDSEPTSWANLLDMLGPLVEVRG